MEETTRTALQAARLHYLQNLSMREIAERLDVSPSTVSRLIALARREGLVEIRIHDGESAASALEEQVRRRFGIQCVAVATPPHADDRERLDEVARVAAGYLAQAIDDGSVLALAWGTTARAIGAHLPSKAVRDVRVVQLNGAGNTHDAGVSYSIEILRSFAAGFGAIIEPFPVPTFFDDPATKVQLWRERSIGRILEWQQRADVLLFSIGAVDAGVPSHVYTGHYLDDHDLEALRSERVVGDIATVFFRADGSWSDIPMNRRASGPDLTLYQQAQTSICVVSGAAKAAGLLGALRAGCVRRLVADDTVLERVLELAGDAES